MKLYLVRHTRVNVPQGICYGQTDVPLADSFDNEAAAVVEQLSGVRFDAAFSSPLSRCVKLAALTHQPFQLDERIKELNFGHWEGKSWNAIFESETGKKWFADYLNERCPQGESYRDMLQRVEDFISDLPQTNGNILVVTHAGVIHAFRVLLHKWTPEKSFDNPVTYGQIVIFAQ